MYIILKFILRFSDKWLQIGGQSKIIADYGSDTITLKKSFKDTNYTITGESTINSTGDDTNWMGSYYIQIPSKTKNSFKIYSRGSLGSGRYVNYVCLGFTN